MICLLFNVFLKRKLLVFLFQLLSKVLVDFLSAYFMLTAFLRTDQRKDFVNNFLVNAVIEANFMEHMAT